jgi:hypothetical protein
MTERGVAGARREEANARKRLQAIAYFIGMRSAACSTQ